MKKRKFKLYSVVQLWCLLTCSVAAWFEWQDAKCWAAQDRPAWLLISKKARRKETRQLYREKILAAYRGEDNGENRTA